MVQWRTVTFALYLVLILLIVESKSSYIVDTWFSFDNVENFVTYPLSHNMYKAWRSLTLIQKLPYLIDRNFLINAKQDYQKLCILASRKKETKNLDHESPIIPKSVDVTSALKNGNATNENSSSSSIVVNNSPSNEMLCENIINLETFLVLLQDFSNTKDIMKFFDDCDTIRDNIGDGHIDWLEFILCRGYYDRNGRPFDVSEFDFLENIVLMDYRKMLNDPRNPLVLELIAKGEEL